MATYSLQPRVHAPRGVRDGSSHFIRINTPIGGGLEEFARLTIRPGGMRAAFFALSQALVDAVAIRLVGNDEHAAIGSGNSGRQNKRASKQGED